ncbi:MAG TPA: hypothetical protein VFW30_04040 [Bryocella sp.]|nr:hypothetical protein [Bryocella sp.]
MTFHTKRSCFSSVSEVPKGWVRAGRALLLLNCVVLIVSTFTEHFWTWDRFLRGGQDFELSLLALLAFFCLILVLAQHFRRSVSELLRRRSAMSRISDEDFVSPCATPLLLAFSSEHPPGLALFKPVRSIILRI